MAFSCQHHICTTLTRNLISRDSVASAALQSTQPMGCTSSMSHPPFLMSQPNLTPSNKKLGRAGKKDIVLLSQSTPLWLSTNNFLFAYRYIAFGAISIIPLFRPLVALFRPFGNISLRCGRSFGKKYLILSELCEA